MAVKKKKKPKRRIPRAKPSKRHKSVKDYNRKQQKKELEEFGKKVLDYLHYSC